MKEIITQVMHYEGNCPKCGKEQKNNDKNYVDVRCYKCKSEESIKQEYSFLTGSTITDIYGVDSGLKTLFITSLHGKKYRIDSGDSDREDNSDLEICEVDK